MPLMPSPRPTCSTSTAPSTPVARRFPARWRRSSVSGRGSIPFRLVTNTTSRSRAMLVQAAGGATVSASWPEELFTATLAGADLARERGHRVIAPFLPEAGAGGPDRVRAGRRHLRPADRPRTGTPMPSWLETSASGWTYDLLQEAFEYLMAGAELIALSRDRYWLRDGRLALDAGPFVAALEYATGVTRSSRASRAGTSSTRRSQSLGAIARRRGRHGGRRPLVGRAGRAAGGAPGLAGPNREVPGGRTRGRGGRPRPRALERRLAARGLIATVYLSPLSFAGVSLRFRPVLPLLVLACHPDSPLRAPPTRGRPAPPDVAPSGAVGRSSSAGHLRSGRAELVRPGRQRPPHPDPRPTVIQRELLFRPGEPYDSARVAESERNLRSAGRLPPGADRFGADRFRRRDAGADQGRLEHPGGLAVPERRRATSSSPSAWSRTTCSAPPRSASVRYRKTTDRTSVALGFRRPRLFAGRVGLAAGIRESLRRRGRGRGARAAVLLPRLRPSPSAWRARTATSGSSASSTVRTRRGTASPGATGWRGDRRLGAPGVDRGVSSARRHGTGACATTTSRRAYPPNSPGR